MEMGEHHTEYTEMAVTDIGNHDIILGTDWLNAHNPSIDWTRRKLLFDRCPPDCHPMKPTIYPVMAELLPSDEREEQYDDIIETKTQGIDASQCMIRHVQRHFGYLREPVVMPKVSQVAEIRSTAASQRRVANTCKPVVTTMVLPIKKQVASQCITS